MKPRYVLVYIDPSSGREVRRRLNANNENQASDDGQREIIKLEIRSGKIIEVYER